MPSSQNNAEFSCRGSTLKIQDPRELGYYLALAQVGIEMVMPTVVGLGLDVYFGTVPWLTILAAVLGFAGGLFHLVQMLRAHDRKSPPDPKP